jgi:hypothetical protein
VSRPAGWPDGGHGQRRASRSGPSCWPASVGPGPSGTPGTARPADPDRGGRRRGRRARRRPAPCRSGPRHRRRNLASTDRPPRPRPTRQTLTCAADAHRRADATTMSSG